MWGFTLIIAPLFSVLGALSAFLITYGEYRKHHADKKIPLKMGIQAAVMTLVVFLVFSFLATFFIQLLF